MGFAQTYKRHERSRESIEAAYENILVLDMKKRQKYGFQPPKTGRRTDVQGDAEACPPLISSSNTLLQPFPTDTASSPCYARFPYNLSALNALPSNLEDHVRSSDSLRVSKRASKDPYHPVLQN